MTALNEILKPKSTEELLVIFCDNYNIDKSILNNRKKFKKQLRRMKRYRMQEINRSYQRFKKESIQGELNMIDELLKQILKLEEISYIHKILSI